ncbi:MAG: RHS repeat-associated core domain-containing protein, partial [Bacteroidota bacterium]
IDWVADAVYSLIISKVTDPENNESWTYTDKKGRQIKTKQKKGSLEEETLFAYDLKDRLTKVIPPGSTGSDDLIYTYLYDGRDNITEKQLPDQDGPIKYVYDNRFLMTHMQDPSLANSSKWLMTTYDIFGRASISGFATSSSSTNFLEELTRTTYDGGTVQTGDIYKGKIYKTEVKILDSSNDWLTTTTEYNAYGQVSRTFGNHHKDLSNTTAEDVTYTYDFADNPTVVSRAHALVGGSSVTLQDRMVYDHSGRLTETWHKYGSDAEQQLSQQSYTHKDQLLEKNLGKTGSTYLQSLDYEYLENGFLKSINTGVSGTQLGFGACTPGLPNVGGNSVLENNDLFRLQLYYDNPTSGTTAQKNGNISQLEWQVKGRETQTYRFTYDYLQRLKTAEYGESNGSITWNNRYETFYDYDVRGNITILRRDGQYFDGSCWQSAQIDDLAYNYVSGKNRLNSITDSAPTASKAEGFNQNSSSGNYGYDANGNMTSNPYKGLTITYNHLNLPKRIDKVGSSDYIEFLYDANGTKLQKKVVSPANSVDLNANPIPAGTYSGTNLTSSGQVASGTTVNMGATQSITLQAGFSAVTGADFTASIVSTVGQSTDYRDYIGGIEYENGTLEAIYLSDSRLFQESGTRRYEYFITDHLGNTRITFTDKDGDGKIEIFDNPATNEVLSENHYYPFGMAMNGVWMSGSDKATNYQYNGKELNEDFGLNLYEYGARWYDPAIGRFTGVDPISDEFPWVSTFNYAENEPIASIDLHGLQRYLATTEGGFKAIGEGFRRMFHAATNFFDNVKASVYGKNTKVISKTEGKVGSTSISTQKKVEASVTITGETNFSQIFEANSNNEVIISKPLVDVNIKEDAKAIQEMEAKTTIKGVSASVKNTVEINLETKETTVSNQVTLSVGQKTGKNSTSGLSVYAKTSKSKGKISNEVGVTAKVQIESKNKKMKNASAEFGAKIYIKK